ncbi:unnamed protein product [Dovyalis caffra]|uniref:Protein kinase domain-containing protein n=1 Tax=Dovyalis caffra TaxID=77055 RepID=A0AAV1RYA5_9ROSI|nr:unnamed protein product [Dovyalis caffra]
MCDTLKNNYQLCEEIGRGRFGTISRCFSPIKNDFFACKSIDKNLLNDATDRECLQNEAKIMSLLSPHPNIVQIFDVYDTEDSLHMVLELCKQNTLYDLLKTSNGGLSEAKSASIMKQLLTAIAHCHICSIVHRDIKPDNILFDEMNQVKLADFGSADWIGEEGTVSGVVGTPYYVAREVVMGRDYNEKVDVWSAGVVLYVMLAGFPPFYGETVEEIFEAVVRGNLRFPPKIFRNVSPEAKDLLRKMICRDVSKRFSAEQALRHPWILRGGETLGVRLVVSQKIWYSQSQAAFIFVEEDLRI